ncbi:MAG: phospho-sugar mutase [Flavobacteriaceae bacterium]
MDLITRINTWKQPPFDQATQRAVHQLEKDPQQLTDAFYKDLEFGTGGMRGIMGVGTNRINRYTLGKASQGLSNYLLERYPEEIIKIAIAYDCRNNSASLAKEVAQVISANGIEAYLFKELRPTPQLSFSVRKHQMHCGIVLTASHNPPEYNGFKVYWKDGGQIIPPVDAALIDRIQMIDYSEINFEPQIERIHYFDAPADASYHQAVIEDAGGHSQSPENIDIVFTALHGTSGTAIPAVLSKAGYSKLHIVEEQQEPNGNFPTVSSPNPEEPQALAMAIEKAKQLKADIAFGTDPDADRLGIVVPDTQGNYQLLNGNQTMVVMTAYLLEQTAKNRSLSQKDFIASTVVSTPMMLVLAKAYGVQLIQTLTGFKWIGDQIERNPHLKFVGGGEESYGYLVGTQVRDKDAVSAALLACEIASDLKAKGSSFYEYLIQCYQKYGGYKERLIAIKKEGQEGAKAILETMERYRQNPPQKLNDIQVIAIEDYAASQKKFLRKNTVEPILLPKANVLKFILADGSEIALRPSGTEPKIKLYCSVQQKWEKNTSWETLEKTLENRLDRLIAAIKI